MKMATIRRPKLHRQIIEAEYRNPHPVLTETEARDAYYRVRRLFKSPATTEPK